MTIWIDANALVDAFERSSIWGWSTEQNETAHKWALDVIEGFLNDTQPSTDGDLISRQDAIEAVQDHFNAGGFKGYNDGQKMLDRITSLPSAPDSRQRGEWKIDECGIYHCPYCHAINNTVYKSFCPSCGADMRKGGEEHK